MPATFTGSLAARLDGLCALSVVEVTRPTVIETGVVYIARGDADMIVSRRAEGLVVLPAPSSAKHRWHPSADRLVASAMEHVAAEQLVGVLMTGMGNDGATAMTALRRGGGRTIAEAEEHRRGLGHARRVGEGRRRGSRRGCRRHRRPPCPNARP
jgi:two-component system chemotaxis response regulator CheB